MKRHRFGLVSGRQRMMLVNDKPSSIVLTESHGEPEPEVGLFAIVLGVDAMPDGRCESHIVSGCDFYILKSRTKPALLTMRRTSAKSPCRRLSRVTRRVAVHQTSISLGHGQHVFPPDLRHARPLTIAQSIPGVPLHRLLLGFVVSCLPSLTALHLVPRLACSLCALLARVQPHAICSSANKTVRDC